MKNSRSNTQKKTAEHSPEHPDTEGKAPLLTPEAKNVHKKERNEGTPDAEQQETTPKQPLYEDKTEAFFQKKQQKNKV